MKRKIAMAWAEALESGLYKQTTGKLREGSKFCCLGVLCNLHALAHPSIAACQDYTQEYMGLDSHPHSAVLKWAGVPASNHYFQYEDSTLIGDNDTRGHDFKRIAATIRKHYKEM